MPFVARWTGTIPTGGVSQHVGAFDDFLPTLAELAGTAAPSGIDGVSYAPVLTGLGAPAAKPHHYWRTPAGASYRYAVRMGDWKFIQLETGAQELYDLSADPAETTNVAGANPLVVAEMLSIIAAESTGSLTAAAPVPTVTGNVTGTAPSYVLDFGTVTLGSPPVTRRFCASNTAGSYSHLLNGAVAPGPVDARLSIPSGEFIYRVDGASSFEFEVTLTPTSVGPLQGQAAVVTGRLDWHQAPVAESPSTITIQGTVAHACSDGLDNDGDTLADYPADPGCSC